MAKAQNKQKSEAKTTEAASTQLTLQPVAAKAMSADVGLPVLRSLAGAAKDETQMQKFQRASQMKKYQAKSALVEAAIKFVRNTPNLDLTALFDKKATAAKIRLNDMLRLAVGTHEIVEKPDGTRTIVVTKAAAAFLPSGTEKKDTAAYKQKDATRANFSRLVTQSMIAAAGAFDLEANVQMDEKTKTLRLSGPKVEKTFGVSEVLLNDQQTEEMKAKPSYTTLADIAAKNRNVDRPSSAAKASGSSPAAPANTIEAFAAICNSFITSLNRFEGSVSKESMRHIDSVDNAIQELRKTLQKAPA